MFPIRYQVVGEEDYMLEISIFDNGEFVINSGTYTSERPRKGRMSGEQESQMKAAVEALGLPREHPLPEGSAAFMATLTIGREGEEASYRFWEGALEEDEELKRLVRLMELL
jgi:hypothetical protein